MAGDLLQIHSGKSRGMECAADRLGLVPISHFKAAADLDAETSNAKSDKSLRSPLTRYDY